MKHVVDDVHANGSASLSTGFASWMLKHQFDFRQVLGRNKSSIGRISSLPASISKVRTILLKSEYALKLQVGPTAARPGPMLLKVAATAEKFVVKSKSSAHAIRNTETM